MGHTPGGVGEAMLPDGVWTNKVYGAYARRQCAAEPRLGSVKPCVLLFTKNMDAMWFLPCNKQQGGPIMKYKNTILKTTLSVSSIISIHYFDYMSDFSFPGESHDFWELLCVDKVMNGNNALNQ